MDSHYDDKRAHRQRELNARRRDASQNDDRKRENRGNKRSKLVHGNYDDFHPNGIEDRYMESSSLQSSISMTSDDGSIEWLAMTNQAQPNLTGPQFSPVTEIAQVCDTVDLAQWVIPGAPLVITPLEQHYSVLHMMKNKSRPASPIVDNTILQDWARTFNDPPLPVLVKIILYSQRLPFRLRTTDGQLDDQARQLMSEFGLSELQLRRLHCINQQITFRSSYGVLLVQGNKFFAKTQLNGMNCRSAIKGYPILKPTGECEHPWETAVRMTAHDVQIRNNESGEWQQFNLDGHVEEDEGKKYLECLISSVKYTNSLRYIGLFIIRLKPDVQIRINAAFEARSTENWYSIDNELDESIFYTLCPFLQYLREHPGFA